MRRYILGVDEAGRGPLAGPVAVGVVMAKEDFDFLKALPELNDSKKISEKKRELIFEQLLLLEKAGEVRFCVKSVSAGDIDTRGITHAVKAGAHAGVRKLAPDTEGVRVYLDGLLHAPEEYEQETIIGGDALIPAIMLASVVAKVSRDRLMVKLAKEYPGYGFEAHKGYGTKAHVEAIKKLGLSDIHRRSFCKKIAKA